MQQLVRADRLAKAGHRTEFGGTVQIRMRRNDDDGRRRALEALDAGKYLPAVHDRHHEIEDDDVDPILPDLMHRLLPIVRQHDMVARILDPGLDQ